MQGEPRTSGGPTILFVDDAEESRVVIRQVLAQSGYAELLEAASATEAFEFLAGSGSQGGQKVHLILLDILMPEMDGLEVLRRLKARKEMADVPVIMVTGDPRHDSLAKAFELGAVDYVNKPVDPVELSARVKSALRLKAEMDRRALLADELARVNESLQRASVTDGLTGIPNRRYFDEVLEQSWRRCVRDRSPLSLCLTDIDFFKNYNDAFGHLRGDECLKRVAALLSSCFRRPGDLVARFGGDEFAIILPTTPGAGARAVADQALEEIRSRRIPHGESEVSEWVTLSLGIATMIPDVGTVKEDLLDRADRALYEAKRLGRDRVFGPTS